MEETKWLTKTKLIILFSLILMIGIISVIIIVHKNNLKKEYIKFENQLEYAAPNYILKEKISLKENEWREINITEILKQKLVINKNSSDCKGYVIANALKNEDKTNEDSNTQSEAQVSNNIKYKAYITCKKIYTTDGYGTKPSSGKKNTEITQTENDTEKPVIKLFGDEKVTLTVGDKYEELGAIATDNIDGDITSKIKVTGSVDTTKAGTYKITYTVTDSSNNKNSITREVIVNEKQEENIEEPQAVTPTPEPTPQPTPTPQPQTPVVTRDTTSPIITFNDNNLYQTICTGSSVDIRSNGAYGYVARDNVDGDITSRVRVTGDTGVINSVGTYNLYYNVSDSAGNAASASKQFSVKDCSTTVPKTSVIIQVSSISVTPNKTTMSVGKTLSLYVTINPSNATNKTVSYSSSNTKVATVNSNGVVTARSKGSATINVTSNNGKVGTCEITVQ